MRQIKFRGRRVKDNGFVYGGRCIVLRGRTLIHDEETEQDVDVEPDSVAQFTNCLDANGEEIYDDDEIRIDFDGAAKVIGEGLLLSTLQTLKPTADAKLYVEYSHYRYRLIWRTHNGRVDTGVDMALLESILPYVEVV